MGLGTQHGFVGWVGGPSRAMSSAKQVQVFHMSCYLSYLKRSLLSCLVTSPLCHPRPAATPHVTCVRPSPPSPPQNPPWQLAASPHPLEWEFRRGCRGMWAVTLVASLGLSERGLGGSERPLPRGTAGPVSKTSGSAHHSGRCLSTPPTQPWPGRCKSFWQWPAECRTSVDTQSPALCRAS